MESPALRGRLSVKKHKIWVNFYIIAKYKGIGFVY